MNHTTKKVLAILEVLTLSFFIVPLLTLVVYRLVPTFESWQTEMLGFPFPVFIYVVMFGLSLLAVLLRRKKPADYGIKFQDINTPSAAGIRRR